MVSVAVFSEGWLFLVFSCYSHFTAYKQCTVAEILYFFNMYFVPFRSSICLYRGHIPKQTISAACKLLQLQQICTTARYLFHWSCLHWSYIRLGKICSYFGSFNYVPEKSLPVILLCCFSYLYILYFWGASWHLIILSEWCLTFVLLFMFL